MGRITLVKGDITEQKADAIVNAANSALLGGGGVDGAIHRAAGPELLEECRKLKGCETGQAKITRGFNLPAKWVIHTVGPIWQGGSNNEDELLASCYVHSLELAVENNIKTIAFPSISTGAYRFPVERAAKIAVREVKNFLKKHGQIEEVKFICFDEAAFKVYEGLLLQTSGELENLKFSRKKLDKIVKYAILTTKLVIVAITLTL